MVIELPIPAFYDPFRVDEIWRVPYPERAEQARQQAHQYHISPAADDPAQLKQHGKYDLTIWPYHVMLGSIGHALVAAVVVDYTAQAEAAYT